MAGGDPLRAKELFDNLDAEWFTRWLVWKAEKTKAKSPDIVVGMYAKE